MELPVIGLKVPRRRAAFADDFPYFADRISEFLGITLK